MRPTQTDFDTARSLAGRPATCHVGGRLSSSEYKRAASRRAYMEQTSMRLVTNAVCTAMLCGAALTLSAHAQGAKQSPSDDDKKFLAMAAQSDQNEIALSEVAEQKATNPAVKAFAKKMVTEHKQMTASMKPFAESWGLTAPTGPDQDHQKELD